MAAPALILYILVTGIDWINAHEQYDIILDDFNPLEDKIVLNPSRAGAGFTGYDLSDDGVITFTFENFGHHDDEAFTAEGRVVLPDNVDLTLVASRIEIADLYDEIYENDQAYQVDLYENWENTPDNWQYSGPYVASNNNDVIYGTRWTTTSSAVRLIRTSTSSAVRTSSTAKGAWILST